MAKSKRLLHIFSHVVQPFKRSRRYSQSIKLIFDSFTILSFSEEFVIKAALKAASLSNDFSRAEISTVILKLSFVSSRCKKLFLVPLYSQTFFTIKHYFAYVFPLHHLCPLFLK